MKLKLQFGMNEPRREANWHRRIDEFPTLVLYKNSKWEFVMYQRDDTKESEYILFFSMVKSYDPNWHANTYESIDYCLDSGWGGKCECGAAYTSFPQLHMFFCPKWTKW